MTFLLTVSAKERQKSGSVTEFPFPWLQHCYYLCADGKVITSRHFFAVQKTVMRLVV